MTKLEWMMDLRKGRERLNGEPVPTSRRADIAKCKVLKNGLDTHGLSIVAASPGRVLVIPRRPGTSVALTHRNSGNCGCDPELRHELNDKLHIPCELIEGDFTVVAP